jgi:hypothetical protein
MSANEGYNSLNYCTLHFFTRDSSLTEQANEQTEQAKSTKTASSIDEAHDPPAIPAVNRR